MGTTLTGTTPQDTYDSLIKVTDNGPLSGSLKTLTDGLGNDSALALSTGAASITGTLAVSGNATFDTNTLFVDAANNRVGIGTITPQELLHLDTSSEYQLTYSRGAIGKRWALGIDNTGTYLANRTDLSLPLYVTNTGNVGIGTSSPTQKLTVNGDIGAASSVFSNFGSATSAVVGFADGNTGFFRPAANTLGITTGGVIRLRVDSDGLKFGSDTSSANALDDYEEGTWTMGVSFGGASVGVTYTANSGTYTKVGRQVTVNGYLSLSSKGSSTGVAKVTGLPFTIPNSQSNYSTAGMWFVGVSFANQFQGNGQLNSTFVEMYEITEAGAVTNLTNSDFSDSSQIMISFTYFV